MSSHGMQQRALRSSLKWNLLLVYAFLIACTLIMHLNLVSYFDDRKSPVRTNVYSKEYVDRFKAETASLYFYNISQPCKADLKCIRTRTVPSTTVCLHSQWRDKYISHDLEDTGRWEPQVADSFLEMLRRDRSAGVLDIGANIGYYTLLAAKMGHQVVAVEPLVDNIIRIHCAAQIEKLFDKITAIRNAIADVRSPGTVRTSGDNQGDTRVELGVEPCRGSCPPTVNTVFLDDLVAVTNFRRAVMKVDIQGYEHKAFKHAAVLFQHVNITYVFMEWLVMKEFSVSKAEHQNDIKLIKELLDFFFQRNYRPYSLISDGGRMLNRNHWPRWPDDIVWHLMPDNDLKSVLLQKHFHQWPP